MNLLDQLVADQAERDAEARRRQLMRMVSYVVPAEGPSDNGWLDSTRELAIELARLTDAPTWEAVTAEPRWRASGAGSEYHQLITLGGDLRIFITHVTPPNSIRDRWTITVNGELIAHRPYRGEIVHSRAALARSILLHLNGIGTEPCDALTCNEKPTHTLLSGAAYCAQHVDLYQ